jgi:hypothetical protein
LAKKRDDDTFSEIHQRIKKFKKKKILCEKMKEKKNFEPFMKMRRNDELLLDSLYQAWGVLILLLVGNCVICAERKFIQFYDMLVLLHLNPINFYFVKLAANFPHQPSFIWLIQLVF